MLLAMPNPRLVPQGLEAEAEHWLAWLKKAVGRAEPTDEELRGALPTNSSEPTEKPKSDPPDEHGEG
jgi:hypothetical protein